MKIWYTGVDQGDGSLGVEFFESQECIQLLEEAFPEEYRGEGGDYFECESFNSSWREVETLEQVKTQIAERLSY